MDIINHRYLIYSMSADILQAGVALKGLEFDALDEKMYLLQESNIRR